MSRMNVFKKEIKLVMVSTLKNTTYVNLRQLALDQLRGENLFAIFYTKATLVVLFTFIESSLCAYTNIPLELLESVQSNAPLN